MKKQRKTYYIIPILIVAVIVLALWHITTPLTIVSDNYIDIDTSGFGVIHELAKNNWDFHENWECVHDENHYVRPQEGLGSLDSDFWKKDYYTVENIPTFDKGEIQGIEVIVRLTIQGASSGGYAKVGIKIGEQDYWSPGINLISGEITTYTKEWINPWSWDDILSSQLLLDLRVTDEGQGQCYRLFLRVHYNNLPPVTCYQCQGTGTASQVFEQGYCDAGWSESSDLTCNITCYKCEGYNIISQLIAGSVCSGEWVSDPTLLDCGNPVYCYQCQEGKIIEQVFLDGECDEGWTLEPPTDCVQPTDYTLFIILGTILLIIVGGIILARRNKLL